MKLKEGSIKIPEQTLINLLDRFIENAPSRRSESKTVNARQDATAWDRKSCYAYMAKLDWEHTEEDPYPPEVRYRLSMTFCWGTQIEILEDNEPEQNIERAIFGSATALKYEGYYDEGWCWCWCHDHSLSGKKMALFMNKQILSILEAGSYTRQIVESYAPDYECCR